MAEVTAGRSEYSATCEHTSVAQGMLVLAKCMEVSIKQGGTADCIFVPDRKMILSGTFLRVGNEPDS